MASNFKYELLHLSNTHNSIADWLIANPGKGQMGKCAAVFEISRAWLSTLIHQDAFQAMLKHKQGKAFEEVVIPLHEKIAGVAHASIEKLGEIVETTQDERLVREIARDTMGSLGYGPSTRPPAVLVDNSTHNTLNVDSSALAEARERRSQKYGVPAIESSSESVEPSPEAQTPQLSHNQEPGMGEASDLRAEHVNSPAPVYRDSESGSEV